MMDLALSQLTLAAVIGSGFAAVVVLAAGFFFLLGVGTSS
jgi:hypothetical protein